MDFEEMNPEIFQPLVATLDPPTTFENHIKRLKQSSVWGTTVELFAAATMFGMDVYEATDSLVPGKPRWMKFSPRHASHTQRVDGIGVNTQKIKWIEILYTCKYHYDSIISLDGQQLSSTVIPKTDTHIVSN
jgi:hypothetical protein